MQDKITEAIAQYNAHIAECYYCEPTADWMDSWSQLCWRGGVTFGVILYEIDKCQGVR